MRIGKPTTTVHFAMKFLNYFGLLRGMVKEVWGGVQVQNLVGIKLAKKLCACTHFSQNAQSKHFRGEKYLVHDYV